MGKEITCNKTVNGDEVIACQVTFTCRDGDCIGSVVQQSAPLLRSCTAILIQLDMRSIGYPVIAIVLGAIWFIWPIVGGIVPSKIFAIVLAGAVYALSRFSLCPFFSLTRL